MAAPNAQLANGTNGPSAAGSSSGLMSTRLDVIDTAQGRILCVSDMRGASWVCDPTAEADLGRLHTDAQQGKLSHLNQLAVEHSAKAIIHAGDFGFYSASPSRASRQLG